MTGSEPGIPSLLQIIQSRAKKFCAKPIAHSPFNPQTVTSTAYGAAAEEQ